MIRIAIATLLILLYPVSALGQEDARWVRKLIGHKHVCEWGSCWREPVYGRVYRHYGYGQPREIALNYTHPSRQGGCMQVRAVVGVEKYDINQAKKHAIDMWMEQVKLHHGVKFMDPENAMVLSDGGKGPDCFISSTGTRWSEAAAEKAGARLQQCEFVARPCEPPRSPRRGY